MTDKKPTVVVYGATSYTATQHLLPYLATHPDADKFDLVLAGRNSGRLEAANALLPGSTRKIVALALDDTPAVEKLVQRADVVINLAGPYSKHNAEALVAACTKHGKAYVDLTGEVWWLKNRIIPEYDYPASKTGARIVPMCGFEAIPGDISIYHALKTLQAQEGRDVAFKSTTNYYDISGGLSGGTIASVKEFAESGEPLEIDEWSLVRANVPHTQSPMKLVYTPPPGLPGVPPYGAFFVGGSTNRPTYRRSWFLSKIDGPAMSHLSNVQFSTAAVDAEPRHGPHTVFSEALYRSGSTACTSWIKAWLMSVILLITSGLYISSRFVRNLVERWIPQPGQGPSPEVCKKGWTRVTNVAESDGDKPLTVVTQYSGKGDPGYSHTARLLAEIALTLVLPPPKGSQLPPLAQIGGVLTPATAGGSVFIDRLRKYGVASIESQIVTASTEPKKTI